MKGVSIDVVRDFSVDVFGRYLACKPLVLRGQLTHWPASRLWNPVYLKMHYGGAVVAIALYDPAMQSTFLEQTVSDKHELTCLGNYLDSLNLSDSRYALREETRIFESHPRMLEELAWFSPFCTKDGSSERYRSLWIGPRGYITGLHTDPGDTLLFQVYGRKRVLLFTPGQDDVLYAEGPDSCTRKFDGAPLGKRLDHSQVAILKNQVQWARVDPFNPDLEKFPCFSQARCIEALISPGDALYIPDGWWHAVESLTDTISVSIEPSFDEDLFGGLGRGKC